MVKKTSNVKFDASVDVVFKLGLDTRLSLIHICIILNGSHVSAGAHLENVIIDKDARIEKKKELVSVGEPLYVKEGDVV